MKPLIRYQLIFTVWLTLALTQFACNLGGQSAATGSPPTPSSEPQATLAERGTPDEAKAMLQKAVEHYTAVGPDQALADFTGRVAPFFDRDLYVVCMDSSDIETANGGFPQYVGTSADALLDTDGKPLGKATWEIASTTTVNSINYHWVNPVSGKTEPKTLFFQKVGADVCGVGVYSP